MRLTSDAAKTWLAAGLGALLAVFLGLFLHIYPVGGFVRNASYDLLHVWRGDIRADEAVVVYMDEISHRDLEQPYNAAWDRRIHARLVDQLTAAGAKVIVFDVVFSDPSDPAADAQFALAITNSGRVILAADFVRNTDTENKGSPPIDLFRDAAAGIGSAETVPDADVTIRRHTREDVLPALSAAAATFLDPKIADQPGPSEKWLMYYGPPHHLPSVRYSTLLTSPEAQKLVRDKAVFIGAVLMTKFSAQRKDEFRNPYSSYAARVSGRGSQSPFISGVEVQAMAFLNLMRNEWLARLDPGWEQALLILTGLVTGMGLVLLRPTFAALSAVAAIGVSMLVAFVLFRKAFIWFPWLLITVQVSAALSWSVLFNSIQLYVQKRLYEQTLKLYLSPKLVKKYANDPELLKRPALKQTVTLVFTDIENFTRLADGMDSDILSKTMNHYFETAVSQGIHKCDGTVVKYIGDAIFAFWNAPEPQEDHRVRACRAALCFGRMNLQWVDGRPIRTRIGIHTGIANVGNFGSRERADYTALGEDVNLASRVEGLNKYLGTTCLATRATHDGINGELVTRELGQFRLKGFERAVQIFELIGAADDAAATLPWREAFAEGLTCFKKHSLDQAEAAFRRVLSLRPDDGPSKFYLNSIAELRSDPPPAQWTGEIELREK